MIKFEKIKEKENTFIKKISFLTDNYVKLYKFGYKKIFFSFFCNLLICSFNKLFYYNQNNIVDFFIHEWSHFNLLGSTIRKIFKNKTDLEMIYYKNESKDFYENFKRIKIEENKIILNMREKNIKISLSIKKNFVYCAKFSKKAYLTDNSIVCIFNLLKFNILFHLFYRLEKKKKNYSLFIKKKKFYKNNFTFYFRKITFVDLETSSDFIGPSSRKKDYQQFPFSRKFREMISREACFIFKECYNLTIKEGDITKNLENVSIGSKLLHENIQEEYKNNKILRENFNKLSIDELSDTQIFFSRESKNFFYFKSVINEVYGRIKTNPKKTRDFVLLIKKINTTLKNPSIQLEHEKKLFLSKKFILILDRLKFIETHYEIESKIWLYSNKNVDLKHKSSIIVMKKEEMKSLIDLKIISIKEKLLEKDFLKQIEMLWNCVSSKKFFSPRGFYIELLFKTILVEKYFLIKLLKYSLICKFYTIPEDILTARFVFFMEQVKKRMHG